MIKNRNEWFNHCQKRLNPLNIPQSVNLIYKGKGWKDWDNFLGTSKFLSFNDAKKYASKIEVDNWNQWKMFFKNNTIPSYPCGFQVSTNHKKNYV